MLMMIDRPDPKYSNVREGRGGGSGRGAGWAEGGRRRGWGDARRGGGEEGRNGGEEEDIA